ncbi:nucleoside-diphosphate-sugar epimerase [Paenibacillus sp. SORGH_AS306]|uniref:SDR family oxidoreductase n=1 Tax=unclassified Paenibacillus TaxID=185978 RepID=UPI00277F1746|nr:MULTISPECIES: SDR family oxidoreductase [unclassified Paenibacillus]MDQ1236014.1 nucleoside-diphosphate-sugar epimerase [Paenibacillus sp. SORGH_AS_0306]MDR6108371.1 nucleoside-diphosphate-sugar epimerase [Paenibacillus sp. SORGH_AS_0338]
MRVFVTGATGYIGSAVVRELIDSGHTVVGLARSDRSAEWLQKLGAEAYRGDIDNVTSLQQGVAQADGVIHLAFKHDFADFEGALATDLQVMESIGAVLEGSDKPFITTAHFNGVASEQVALSLAQRGVRTSIIELCPSVHGEGDTGFIPKLIAIAKEKGVAAYIEEGMNRWPAVHRLDAAHLYCLALEKAEPGSRLDGVADEGIAFRDIATVIGKHLNVPVVSIPQDQAQDHFGFLGALVALDIPRSSQSTQQQLGWQPVHPSLLEDLEQGHYFR